MDILQQAAKIKGAQLAKEREIFEAYPQCIKNSLFEGEKEGIKEKRALPFDERRALALELKDEGNGFFKDGNWKEAIEKYESSAGMFRWLKNSNNNWRKEGLLDKDMTLMEEFGDTSEERKAGQAIIVNAYNNLARAYLKNADWKEAVKVSDMLLDEIDADNVKALYLRAQSRYLPPGAGAVDLDFAIRDLKRASVLDPQNKDVAAALSKYTTERKRNNLRDRATFGGMFERGQMYDAESRGQSTSDASGIKETAGMVDGSEDEVDDDDSWTDEELQIREALTPMAKMQGFKLNSRQKLKEMQDEALSQGIDLTDPRVRMELMRLAREKDGFQDDETDEVVRAPTRGQQLSANTIVRGQQLSAFDFNMWPWIGAGFGLGVILLYLVTILTDVGLLPKQVQHYEL